MQGFQRVSSGASWVLVLLPLGSAGLRSLKLLRHHFFAAQPVETRVKHAIRGRLAFGI